LIIYTGIKHPPVPVIHLIVEKKPGGDKEKVEMKRKEKSPTSLTTKKKRLSDQVERMHTDLLDELKKEHVDKLERLDRFLDIMENKKKE